MKKIFLSPLILFFCSCVSQNVYLPNQTFHVPESFGKFGTGSVGVGYSQYTKVTVIKDVTTTPPDSTVSFDRCTSSECSGMYWAIPVHMGLISGLDLTYTNGILGAQYQFIGSAHDLGLKASVSGGYANQKTSQTGSSSSAETKSSFSDIGLSLGYRFSNEFLVYVAGSYLNSASDTVVTNTSTYSYSDTGKNARYGLGFRANSSGGYFLLEGTQTTTTWSRTSTSFSDFTAGFGAGVIW
jgi:hypothetical protein